MKKETRDAFVEALRNIFDDHDFIFGMQVYCDSEEKMQTVLKFIQDGDEVSVETVTVLAITLNE